MSLSPEAIDMAPVAEAYRAVQEAVGRAVVGQREAIELLFVTLLCAGHSLLEGVPGLAKTLLVRRLASVVGVGYGRIQFTPDLLPSDVIGTTVLDPSLGEPRFRPGPLFTDLLLADEINRASAKSQAALLEAMEERAVTVDGTRHPLSPHFAVFATQNPVEHEGTYPLPEAQLDRFLFKIRVDYPSDEEEREILRTQHVPQSFAAPAEAALEARELDEARRRVAAVIVRDEIFQYVSDLIRSTRRDLNYALGASPRAGVMLVRAAKAHAALEGRDYVLPEDVQAMCVPTLRHRVQLDPAAEVEGRTPDEALEHTLRTVAVPR